MQGTTNWPMGGRDGPSQRLADLLCGDGPSFTECLKKYLRDIAGLPLLTADQERELARRAGHGDEEARRRLLVSNLRLVVKVAARYARYGIPLCDLIQEGNLGLIKAVGRFSWERGTRFSTYAAYWIREAILRALTDGGHAVRLSGHAFKQFQQMAEKADALAATLFREPTISEIASAMDTTTARAAGILSAAAFPLSLNEAPEDERGTTALEEIACSCGCDPADLVRSDPPPEQVQRAIVTVLSERERWIVVHSYGLDGSAPKKLRELASELCLSLERVRQIRERALLKLRRYLTDVPAATAGPGLRPPRV